MEQCYSLSNKFKPNTAFADTEGKTPLAHKLIPSIKEVSDLPFDLVLKKPVREKEGWKKVVDLTGLKYLWLDYQPNTLAWPLMSERMQGLISKHLTGKEGISWIRALVRSPEEERHYFIPRFERRLDVLDEEKTIFVSGTMHIVKPVFSLDKVRNYGLFHKPQENFWEVPSGLYVGSDLREKIKKEKLTGVDFESVSAV